MMMRRRNEPTACREELLMRTIAKRMAVLCAITLAALIACSTPGVKEAPGTYLNPAAIDVSAVLPAPPADGSLAGLADLETVRMVQSWRTPDQIAWAKKTDGEDPFHYNAVVGSWFTAKNLPGCAKFFMQVLHDARKVSNRVKDLHKRPRPPKRDERVTPSLPIPKSLSYPSGHSTRTFTIAYVIAELFPDKRTAVVDFAHRDAWARIIAGVHYPTDDVGGRLLAGAVFSELNKSAKFRATLDECRAEIAAYRKRAGVR